MRIDFVKLTNKWFADIVNYPGNVMDLEMVCGADELLEEISQGKRQVTLNVMPDHFGKEDKYIYRLHEIDNEGATYFNSEGRSIWLCNVTIFAFGDFPSILSFELI